MSSAYLQELSVSLEKQLFWLDYSYQQVKDLSVPENLVSSNLSSLKTYVVVMRARLIF